MNILGKEYPKVGRINRRVLIVIAIVICILFFLALLRGVGNKGSKNRNSEQKVSSTSSYNDWIPSNITYTDVLQEKELPGSVVKPSDNKEINQLRSEIENLKQAMRDQKKFSYSEVAKQSFAKAEKKPPQKKPPKRKDKSGEKALKYQQQAFDSEIFFTNKTGKALAQGLISTAQAATSKMGEAQQRLSQLQNNLPGGAGSGRPTPPDLGELGIPGFGAEDELISQNNQKGKLEFMNETVDPDKVYNKDQLHVPLSPYEIKSGSVIPCTLITGLNSDLPGSIAAQVRETVYDSVTGNHVLIPQGAKMIGSYDSIITYGQERTLIVFNRIIMPNGDSISLEKFQGIDLQGYSGLSDKVNNHWWRILGSVVVSGVLQGLADRTDEVDELSLDDSQIVANSVSAEVAKTAAKIINKQINIQPTLEVRPGWNFNVFIEKDLILQPYNG